MASFSLIRSIDLPEDDINKLDFVKNLEDRLICPVCKNVLQKPMQMSCGHHVCSKCLDTVFGKNESTNCPVNDDEVCKDIRRIEVFPDASVGREVLNLKVKCPNKTHGCDDIVVLSKLQEHKSECKYQTVTCQYLGCNKEISQQSISQHHKTCEYKPIVCDLCHLEVATVNFKEHKSNVCLESLVPCTYGCNSAPMKRRTLGLHFENCPKKPGDCAFKYFNCTFKGTAEKISQHSKDSVVHHIELVALHVSDRETSAIPQATFNVSDDIKTKISHNESQVKELKLKIVAQAEKFINLERRVSELPRKTVLEQQSRELNDLKEKVSNLAEQMRNMDGGATVTRYGTLNKMAETFTTRLDAQDRLVGNHDVRIAEMDLRFQIMETASYNGVIIWKIKDYQRRKQEAINGRTLSLYSQPFYTSKYGYKMCVRVYLNGDGMGKNTHVSLFFVVMGGEFDSLLPWPFQQKVTLYILDQGREGRHLSDHFHPDASSSSFRKPTGEMNVASGCPLFVSHSVLENRSNNYIKDDIIFIRCNVDTSGLSNF